ncbi:MAG: glycerol-3-phosphate 1-O-acyltransferase PlsY [Chthonomonadaceae bacterium]|nr:glycerol-3-phosphate 1-O-acyltransferase PlsY [Chthonomonadaceae bacterium]
MALTVLVFGLVSFVLGSIPFGFLVGRKHGVDVTKSGSGNIGATNVLRVLGKAPAALVILLDISKGVFPVMLTRTWLSQEHSAQNALVGASMVGFMAVAGHVFSPFLKFQGGKGVATGLGVVFASCPIAALCCLGAFTIVMLTTRIVSLGSMLGCVTAIVTLFVTKQPLVMCVVLAAMGALIIYRHSSNIRRLLRGQEPRISSGSKHGNVVQDAQALVEEADHGVRRTSHI